MSRALFLAVALVALPAAAQDDDLPALPTAPKPKPKAQPKPRPRAQPKRAPVVDDDLPALPVQKGEVLVKLLSPLKGAKLTIDGQEIGLLPQPAQSLSPGEHTVSVRRLGYALFSKKVVVAGGKTAEVAVTLEASAAVLTVSSDVAGAQVYVNRRLVGTTPLVELEVAPGNLDIAVKKEGYRDATQIIAAKAGRDYPVEVKLGAPISSGPIASTDAPVRTDLTPPPTVAAGDQAVTGTSQSYEPGPPVYQRWWFWAAVVVVAAGAVTGAGVVAYNDRMAKTPAELRKSAFPCQQNGNMCETWINEPSAIVPLRY